MKRRFSTCLALGSFALLAALAACDEDTTTTPSTPGTDASTRDATPAEAAATSDAAVATDSAVPKDANVSTCGLVVPQAYDGAAFATNAAIELGLRQKLTTLLKPLKDAEASLAVMPTAAALQALYADGTPSLKSITTTAFAARVDNWLTAFEAAAGNTWTPAANADGGAPVPPGGKFGDWLFTETGTDIRQTIEKGLFGAAHFKQASTLLAAGPVTEATLDRVLALYGTNPSFPLNDKTGDGGVADPDFHSALYAKRREANDASNPGVYLRIKRAFITAQAAIRRGADCNQDRDAAIATLKSDWEKALLATSIFYLNDATTKLGGASPTAADLASGLHGYGEAVAFVSGFRELAAASRIITDAQIDDILATLGAPVGGPVTSYKFVTDTGTELPKLGQAMTKVAAIYGFTQAEINVIKVNH